MSPWSTADISLIEAFGDVGTEYGEIETVFYRDEFGPMFGNDQDADMSYDNTTGQMILGLPADVGANEPILNIVPHTAGITYSSAPATVLDIAHPTVVIWDSGVTDLIAFYNDDTLSHILSEVAGGVEVDLGLWLGDATGDQAKLRIYGYDETAAGAAYYTIGTHDDANNLLSLQIGLITTTAATENLVICARGDTPAINVEPLNTVAHPKLSVWGATAAAGDFLVIYNDDTDSWIRTGAGGIFFDAIAAGDGVDIRFYPEGTPVIDIGADIFTTGVFIKVGYDSAETSAGDLRVFQFQNDATLTLGGDLYGIEIDFNTNITSAVDQDITVFRYLMPALTQSTTATTSYTIIDSSTIGALIQDTLAGTINWTGWDLDLPAITESTGTVTVKGIDIDAGAVTTGGTLYGIELTMPATYTTVNEIAMVIEGDGCVVNVITDTQGVLVTPTNDESVFCFEADVVEQTGATVQTHFHSDGGSPALSVTNTTRGIWIDWDGITRDANAPILEGIRIDWPASVANFGTSSPFTLTDGTNTWITILTADGTIVHPTLRIYDSGGTDYIQFYDDDANAYIQTNANPLFIEPTGGVIRFQDLADADDSEIFQITVVDAQGFVLLEAEPSGLFRFQDVGDGDASDIFQIEVTDGTGYTKLRDETGVIRFDDLDDADSSDYLEIVTTDASGEVLLRVPNANNLVLQGATSTAPGDVVFFLYQTDPGTDVMAAGEVPRFTFWGWDHAASSIRGCSFMMASVEEGQNPDDDEIALFHIVLNNGTHGIVIHDSGTFPEWTAPPASHPTVLIYDNGATDYIQFYDDDTYSWIIGNPNPINIAPSNDVDNYIRFSTPSDIPGFASIAADMDIQNLAGTSGVIYDVRFFANQSDPGSGVLPVGSVPEIRIYGWEHNTSVARFNTLRTISVAEGIDPTDDELTYFNIGLITTSRVLAVTDMDETLVEITAAMSNPTLRIYNAAGSDYIGFFDDNSDSWITSNPNQINIAPNNDNDDYIQFSTQSNVPGFTTIGDADLSIQNQAAANPFDVMFFASQTVPAATPAAGSTPELRIYGWSSATINTQVYSSIQTSALTEGTAETGDEVAVMRIQPANNRLVISEIDDNIEFTAALTDPAIEIYGADGANYIRLSHDDLNGSIFVNSGAVDILAGDANDFIRFSTQANVVGFTTIGDDNLSIQNQAATNPFDVIFFASQTDPGTDVMAVGEVPEIRIYGWDHAGTSLRYNSLKTISVAEGVDPDDDEYSFFMIGLDPAGSRNVIICDADETIIELAAVFANPTLTIYDAGATDWISFSDSGSASEIRTNVNPLYLLTGTGITRFRDRADSDNTLYLEIVTPDDGTYVQLIESGNSAQSQNYVCGFATEPTLSGGAVLMFTSITGTAWASGDYAMGAATAGSWLFNDPADEIMFSLPLPELFVDTGVAGELILGITFTTTNADDRFDYAVYDEDGVALVDEVDQTLGATSGTFTINLGALVIVKGNSLVVAMIGFETTVPGATTATVTQIELTYEVGIENNIA